MKVRDRVEKRINGQSGSLTFFDSLPYHTHSGRAPTHHRPGATSRSHCPPVCRFWPCAGYLLTTSLYSRVSPLNVTLLALHPQLNRTRALLHSLHSLRTLSTISWEMFSECKRRFGLNIQA
jgi:hypothetical protein